MKNNFLKIGTGYLSLALLVYSLNGQADESDCSKKIKGHYQAIFHKLVPADHNTFLNNFVHRKSCFAHSFGYPKTAFLNETLNDGANFIAANMVEKAKKMGKGAQALLDKYESLLQSGAICKDLAKKDRYFRPRVLREYILDKLKEDVDAELRHRDAATKRLEVPAEK